MIENVVISNFEKIKELNINLFSRTVISGRNGAGKTAIARAILWCLSGRDIDGTVNATRYIGKHKANMSVAVKIDGVTYERYRTKTKSTFTRNGEACPDDAFLREANLTPEALLILFFPGFFLKMNEMKQREVFMAIAPQVDEKEILKTLLGDVEFNLTESPKAAFKNFNDLRIAYDKRLSLLKGRAEAFSSCANWDKGALQEIEAEKSRLEKAFNESKKAVTLLEEQEKAYQKFILSKTNFEILSKQREDIIAQNAINAANRSTQVNANEFRAQRAKLHDEFLKVESELASVLSRGKREKENLDNLKKGNSKCPTCGSERAPSAETILESEVRLNKDRAEYARVAKNRDDIKEQLTQISDIVAGFLDIPNDKPVPNEPTILPEVAMPEPEEIVAAKQIHSKISLELSQVASKYAIIKAGADMASKNEAEYTTLTSEIESTQKALDKATKVVEALHPKTGLPSIALQKRMENVKLERFTFQFTEQLKNGDERECFHIVRNDEIPIEYLSSGEQIKFCVDLSNLIMNLTETSFRSIFIEKNDLVDSEFCAEDCQIICEKVADCEGILVTQ